MAPQRLGTDFRRFGALLVGVWATALGTAFAAPQSPQPAPSPPAHAEPRTPGGPALLRRLTEKQYRNSIADIFGPDIEITGRFEPILRPERGLIATAAARSAISPAGFEQYYSMARGIANQVVDDTHRVVLLSCRPAAVDAPDESCTTSDLRRLGRLIFRRPLSDGELKTYVDAANAASAKLGNSYQGLALGLAAMLVAPEFLMRVEATEPDPDRPGALRLTAYSKAERLIYLLWNTTPDESLLRFAQSGELHTAEGLARQIDRLIASPRLQAGVRAFFEDMLEFERFEDLQKDPVIFPQFNVKVAADYSEQMLRTISHHLIERNGDYRDLFTTRRTFLTRSLGAVQRIAVDPSREWVELQLPATVAHAGIISHPGFTSLFSHPGRSSATLRGKAIRELLLCQKVPDPPGNVDFAVVDDTANPQFKTARGRLSAHANDPSCAGCHRFTDPLGLTLEVFDGIGAFRTSENGVSIDTSGELDGKTYRDVTEFGRVLHDHPRLPTCLVRRLYSYAAGREPLEEESEWLDYLQHRLAENGHSVVALLRGIASSDALYRIRMPAETPSSGERRTQLGPD